MNNLDLITVDTILCENGVNLLCHTYELSNNKNTMVISYFDKALRRQFILVFRLARLSYKVYAFRRLTTFKTAQNTAKHIHGLIKDIVAKNEYYKTMSVYEYNQLATLSNSKKVELYRRLQDLK